MSDDLQETQEPSAVPLQRGEGSRGNDEGPRRRRPEGARTAAEAPTGGAVSEWREGGGRPGGGSKNL